MSEIIGELAEEVPTVNSQSLNEEIYNLFKKHPKCAGIVILNGDKPIGLMTRINFFQKLGTLYGYNLYIKKPINQLMNKNILIVDYYSSIIDVSRLAMSRKEEELYDYVIVTKQEKYVGVVSISRLLMKFAELQAEIASLLNPLTKLPGNRLIQDKLEETIKKDEYSILYVDIDHFKAYNDVYGFGMGDEIIQTTANVMKGFVNEYNGFLGHIGGDDFLIIFDHYYYESCCELILQKFDEVKPRFYFSEHYKQDYVFTEDRSGVKRKIPLISLSIGIVTNKKKNFQRVDELIQEATRIKKLCKQQNGNCALEG